ncbi:MAG: hypothetical protein ACYSUI_19260 [Planctomycetota bacterium]|jgi:hypothetical protein
MTNKLQQSFPDMDNEVATMIEEAAPECGIERDCIILKCDTCGTPLLNPGLLAVVDISDGDPDFPHPDHSSGGFLYCRECVTNQRAPSWKPYY